MEAHYLDHYSYLDSPVHRISAPIKLAGALLIVFLVLAIPFSWWIFHGLVWVLLIGVALISHLPLWDIIKRLRWAWLAIFLLAFGRYWEGDAIGRFAKASACLMTMMLLANTTRFVDLLQVLSSLPLPKVLLTTLSLMYRYLFVLTDEKNRMLRARRSRTFVEGRRRIWKVQANIIAHLFARCVDRAGRIHAAMSSRGWE